MCYQQPKADLNVIRDTASTQVRRSANPPESSTTSIGREGGVVYVRSRRRLKHRLRFELNSSLSLPLSVGEPVNGDVVLLLRKGVIIVDDSFVDALNDLLGVPRDD